MILYENTVKNFLKASNNRSLIRYMINEYENSTGTKVCPLIKLRWKYMMNVATQLVYCTDKVLDDCGVRIDLYIAGDYQDIIFILASSDGAKDNVLFISMIPWESVHLSDEDDVVYYDEGTGEGEKKTIHPSYQLAASSLLVSSGIENEFLNIQPIAFLFDCEYTHENDIITHYNRELTENFPVYYNHQLDKISLYAQEVLSHGGGTEVLRRLRLIGNSTLRHNGLLYPAQKFILSTVKNYLQNDEIAWFIIKSPSGTGGSTLLNEIRKEADAQQKEIVLIDKDEDVDPKDFPKDRMLVWIYDEAEDSAIVKSVCHTANQYNIHVNKLKLNEKIGVKDGGKGLNWLQRYLQAGYEEKLEWDPDEYSIIVVDKPEDLPNREDYASIAIKDSIYMDPETEIIHGGDDEKKELYSRLSKGRKGIYLYIEDPVLNRYIKKEIQDAQNKYNWLKEYQNIYSMDTEQLEEAQKEKLKKDSVNKKYSDIAIRYMGQSAWDKLEEQSKTWILSGLLAYHDMKKYDQLLDFSGVCISICKAVERETAKRFFERYKQYLENKYTDDAVDRAPYTMVEEKYGKKDFIKSHMFSLGKIPRITGIKSDGKVANKYAWNEFDAYCDEEFLISPESSFDTIAEHMEYTEKIRIDFRNQAAHSDTMDVIQAKECIDYVVGVMHRLGIMLDAYRF